MERELHCNICKKYIWNCVPIEISNIIMEFCGIVKCRCGVYINQISPYDSRYKMLLTLPQLHKGIYDDTSFVKESMVFMKIPDSIYTFEIRRLTFINHLSYCVALWQTFDKIIIAENSFPFSLQNKKIYSITYDCILNIEHKHTTINSLPNL